MSWLAVAVMAIDELPTHRYVDSDVSSTVMAGGFFASGGLDKIGPSSVAVAVVADVDVGELSAAIAGEKLSAARAKTSAIINVECRRIFGRNFIIHVP